MPYPSYPIARMTSLGSSEGMAAILVDRIFPQGILYSCVNFFSYSHMRSEKTVLEHKVEPLVES